MEHRGGRRMRSGRRTRRKEEGGPQQPWNTEEEEGRGGEGGRGGRRTRRTPSACTDAAHQPYVTQPSGSLGLAIPAGLVARALSPRLSPEQPATLDPHPPAVGPFFLACPPSNQQC
ncbi:hypothetical protein DVH24_027677 [Malus domestica]|uniref:Uncharacterized protein n=1 Tax=Malus domestica TaxID=3750 RepID=A0A498H9P3_MALDO|nr:hypothetical protein DVH24_027677 [Malus domestica]